MDDIARLQIRVASLEAEVADRRLTGLARSGGRAERATDSLRRTSSLLTPVLSAVAAALSVNKIIDYADEFTNLENKLKLATDGLREHEEAIISVFEVSQDTRVGISSTADLYFRLSKATRELAIDQNTLVGITEVINQTLALSGSSAQAADAAIIQLGQGLSAGALRGQEFNSVVEQAPRLAQVLSDSLGVNIGQLRKMAEQGELTREVIVRAVLDQASVVRSEFRDIEATIDSTTTRVSNSATLLVASFDDMFDGSATATNGLNLLVDALDSLTASVRSGQLGVEIDANAERFKVFAEDAEKAIAILEFIWEDFTTDTALSGKSLTEFLTDAFAEMPENIRSFIQIMTVELAAFIDKSQAYGQEILDNLRFWEDESFDLESRLEVINQARRSSIEGILVERQVAIDSFDAQIDRAGELRREYDFLAESRQRFRTLEDAGFTIEDLGRGKDLLITYQGITQEVTKTEEAFTAYLDSLNVADTRTKRIIQSLKDGQNLDEFDPRINLDVTVQDNSNELSEKEKRRIERERKRREKEFENLRKSLRTEEEVIQESYDRRLAIILANTEQGSKQQQDLRRRLNEEFATEALGELQEPDTYEEQISQLEEFYNRRKELILANTSLTELERTELEEELTKQRNQRLEILEQQRLSNIFQSSSQLFDGLAGLSKTFAGEQSDLYKVMFAASKAFAIADAIVKIQQGIANAAAIPFPANLAAIGSVVSATAGIVSTIQGTEYAGNFESGGVIPAGKIGLVGEFGPELVEGPANVRSRRETAEMFNEAESGQSTQTQGSAPVIKIVNVLDPSLVSEYMNSEDGEEVILNTISSNPERVKAVANA